MPEAPQKQIQNDESANQKIQMSKDRIEVTLGPDGEKNVFKTFEQVKEWLANEREFWSLFQNESQQSREAQPIWQPFDNFFREITDICNQVSEAGRQASENKRRAAQANFSPQQREQLMRQSIVDYKYFSTRLVGVFSQYFQNKNTRGYRSDFPKWFQTFRWRMRLKKTLTTTRGNDENTQVIFADRENYVLMIKIFFALKVWVLASDYILKRY